MFYRENMLELSDIKQKSGEFRLVNPTTAKKDGFRLYICTPVPYKKGVEVEEKELKPEIRFKANNMLEGLHIHEEIKKGNSAFCFQIIMNILNQIIFAEVPIQKHRHTVFINKLWGGLNNKHKSEIIRTIYEKNPLLLAKKATLYKSIIRGENTDEFFNLACHSYPITLANTVEPQRASHFIYITNKDLNSKEGVESIDLYTKKHPNECCIITKKSALLHALNHHNSENQTKTLVIFAHNNIDKKKKFLDWTIETAGKELGALLNSYPCIGHLDMFTCHSGPINSAKLDKAIFFEKSNGKHDLSRSLSIYSTQENPFEIDTLAHQIHQVVSPCIATKKRPPLALTFSPIYISVWKNQFVGTSNENAYCFNEKNSLLHYKKITTFLGDKDSFKGVCLSKSNHHKNSRKSALLKDNEIVAQKTALFSGLGFFSELSPISEKELSNKKKEQISLERPSII